MALEHPRLTLKLAEVMFEAMEGGGEPTSCDRAAQRRSTVDVTVVTALGRGSSLEKGCRENRGLR